jgi:hypothetical protein
LVADGVCCICHLGWEVKLVPDHTHTETVIEVGFFEGIIIMLTLGALFWLVVGGLIYLFMMRHV